MADLETRIFVGTDKDDATAYLNAAIADGSWSFVRWQGYPVLWITHRPVPGQAMLPPGYELHVTAWVTIDAVAGEQTEALADEHR